MRFNKIVVIGSGQIAYECAKCISVFPIKMEVFEYVVTGASILKEKSISAGFLYKNVDKIALYSQLNGIEEKCLVISAGNTYLFPSDILQKENLEVINWHNSILPNHKGRNAEAWAIFDQDEQTGITWHFVDCEVDHGNIIDQARIPISLDMTSLKLYQIQCQIGFERFQLFIGKLLDGKINGYVQNSEILEKIHFSKEIPNDGFLNIDWAPNKISAFLRAMDYGGLGLLGKPKLKLGNNIYQFSKYKIERSDDENKIEVNYNEEKKFILIKKEGRHFLLNKVEKIL